VSEETSRRRIDDSELGRLAIFPLPEAVLFPHTAMPLHVFEPRYVQLVRDCVEQGRPLAVWQLDGSGAEGAHGPALRTVATVGRIGLSQEAAEGRLEILVEGLERVRLAGESASGRPYRVVSAIRHPLEAPAGADVGARVDTLQGVSEALAVNHPRASRLLQLTLQRCADPGELSDVLCAITHEDGGARQALLETSSVTRRLDRVIETLSTLLLHVPLSPEEDDETPQLRM
jgi:Lon protease-like protein